MEVYSNLLKEYKWMEFPAVELMTPKGINQYSINIPLVYTWNTIINPWVTIPSIYIYIIIII